MTKSCLASLLLATTALGGALTAFPAAAQEAPAQQPAVLFLGCELCGGYGMCFAPRRGIFAIA